MFNSLRYMRITVFFLLFLSVGLFAGNAFKVSSELQQLERTFKLHRKYSADVQKQHQLKIAKHLQSRGKQIDINNLYKKLFSVNKQQDQNPNLNKNSFNPEYGILEEISEFWFGSPTKDRSLYTYDENFDNNQILYQSWLTSDWVNTQLNENTYDDSHNPIQALIYGWVDPNSIIAVDPGWVNQAKFNYTYENNLLTQWADSFWVNNAWVPAYRELYTYDENQREIEYVYQAWNSATQMWEDWWHNFYTYDSNGNLIEDLDFDYSLTTYTYDSNNDPIQMLVQYWNGTSWDDDYLTKDTFDANHNLVETLSQYWDGAMWVNDYKATLTYNEFNNQTGFQGYIPNGANWTTGNRGTFTYDDYQNEIQYFVESWNGSAFEIFIRYTRTFIHLVSAIEEVSGFAPAQYSLGQNYPNPFNPLTNIEFSIPVQSHVKLLVFDLTGREVATLADQPMQAGTYSVQFDASALSSGIYFYRLSTSKDFVQTKKLTLLK